MPSWWTSSIFKRYLGKLLKVSNSWGPSVFGGAIYPRVFGGNECIRQNSNVFGGIECIRRPTECIRRLNTLLSLSSVCLKKRVYPAGNQVYSANPCKLQSNINEHLVYSAKKGVYAAYAPSIPLNAVTSEVLGTSFSSLFPISASSSCFGGQNAIVTGGN